MLPTVVSNSAASRFSSSCVEVSIRTLVLCMQISIHSEVLGASLKVILDPTEADSDNRRNATTILNQARVRAAEHPLLRGLLSVDGCPPCRVGSASRRAWNARPSANDRLRAENGMSPPVFLIRSIWHDSGESEFHHA